METMQKWEESGKSWYDYAPLPVEISEELFAFLQGCEPASFAASGKFGSIFQSEEVYDSDQEYGYVSTFLIKENKYYSLGVLPMFRQEEKLNKKL